VSAFVAPSVQHASSSTTTTLNAERREFLSSAAAAVAAGVFLGVAAPGAANAIRDYENVAYLGGSDKIDINNANVRAYLKLQGMYPSAGGKIASHGPYNSVSEIYNIPGLTGKEKDAMKKHESKFVALKPEADYVIDRINNGLYR
jgi:photosystem II PsbU protein